MPSATLKINGWTIFTHTLFLTQLETLVSEVERLRRKAPEGYQRKNATRRLAAIVKLALEVIPGDPARTEYRQGGTLGEGHAHWFRAKFFQRYRLFFRYHRESRIIVYAWVNDEESKRAYESGQDAYRVFRRMLAAGHPPDDWDSLLAEAKKETERLNDLTRKL